MRACQWRGKRLARARALAVGPAASLRPAAAPGKMKAFTLTVLSAFLRTLCRSVRDCRLLEGDRT